MGSIPPETVRTIQRAGKGAAGIGGTGVLGLLIWLAVDMREQNVATRQATEANGVATQQLSGNVERLTEAVTGLDKTVGQVQANQMNIQRRGDEFRQDIERLKEKVHPYRGRREEPNR